MDGTNRFFGLWVLWVSVMSSACGGAIYSGTTAPTSGRLTIEPVLAPGTSVLVAVSEQRRVRSNRQGAIAIRPTVSVDVFDHTGRLIVRAGARVRARYWVREPRGVGRGGVIRVEVESVLSESGQLIPLVGSLDVRGHHRIGGTVVMSVLLPGWLLWLGRRGEHAVIEPGQELVAHVR